MRLFSLAKSLNFRSFSNFCLAVLLTIPIQGKLSSAQAANSENPLFTQPRDRITNYVDDEQRITLIGNRHPLATAENDAGPVAPDYRMDRMVLTLLPDAAQETALQQLLEEQQNPESPYYHRWLSPQQYGESFGVSDSDAAQVTDWLRAHGMEVEEIAGGRRAIVFSGTAEQVESAFHTQIHAYKVAGEIHHANDDEPQIPTAFSGVVGGVVSLHDFRAQPMHNGARLPAPQFTSGENYYLAPGDFSTIYNLNPAYQQKIVGSGQSIAIVARSNINMSDVARFRSSFGLPANNPQIILNGTNPGIWNFSEETEADLDVEWAGAVAKGAGIKFVVSKPTNSTDGSYLSAQYIVSHDVAPILTMSFGLCEAELGASGNTFINSLWEQAAAEGITVLVSAGDSGAADCDSASSTRATHGRAVNGLCSTPYSTCVGGTEFNDTARPSLYWSSKNASGTQSSALSYIPEITWNESISGLWAGGGGASMIYRKPAWQDSAGVPADGKRDVPDVSLSSAGHDGYLIYQDGELYVVGGTSAAAPSFAGIMALVLQSERAKQGNANPVFYALAGKQLAGGAAVFHDVVHGNNSVPGQTGFNAAAAYDQATGLGSVDGSVLVGHWNDATIGSPALRITPSTSAVPISAGSNVSIILSVDRSGGFSAPVEFSLSGLPSGMSATFAPATLPAPGSGVSRLRVGATSSVKPGTYNATVSASAGSTKQQIPLSIVFSRSAAIR
ncbi:MAG TPA: S53 family peptidase [Candidatus Sulfotelmatobacter sp.]|jgi:subtilase family serine protease